MLQRIPPRVFAFQLSSHYRYLLVKHKLTGDTTLERMFILDNDSRHDKILQMLAAI